MVYLSVYYPFYIYIYIEPIGEELLVDCIIMEEDNNDDDNDDNIIPIKYSKTKTTSYEKKFIKILLDNDGNYDDDEDDDNDEDNRNKNAIIRKKRKRQKLNDYIVGEIALEMSNISSDESLVHKFIKKKMDFMIRNTIHNSIDKLELIPDYEKKRFKM